MSAPPPGFSDSTFAFLRGLAAHNERAWFELHKDAYRDHVLTPMRQLVGALAPAMLAIDPALEVDPRRGAVSRIHRDTRFSRDKTPYRINQWIAFKRPGSDWMTRPAFFMEYGVESYRYGMGYYAAMPSTMAAVRQRIAESPRAFAHAMAQAEAAGFIIAGDPYKRPRDGVAWLQRKNPYLVMERPIGPSFVGPSLVSELAEGFTAAAQFYRFLLEPVQA